MVNYLKNKPMVMHYKNILLKPENFYAPFICEKFSLNKKGFEKILKLKFPTVEKYIIYLDSRDNPLPTTYEFRGQLKIEFWHDSKLLKRDIINKNRSVVYDDAFEKLTNVDLYYFDIPLIGNIKSNINIKLMVIEPDNLLKNDLNMCIMVSPII
jgi:hypothetical protein